MYPGGKILFLLLHRDVQINISWVDLNCVEGNTLELPTLYSWLNVKIFFADVFTWFVGRKARCLKIHALQGSLAWKRCKMCLAMCCSAGHCVQSSVWMDNWELHSCGTQSSLNVMGCSLGSPAIVKHRVNCNFNEVPDVFYWVCFITTESLCACLLQGNVEAGRLVWGKEFIFFQGWV